VGRNLSSHDTSFYEKLGKFMSCKTLSHKNNGFISVYVDFNFLSYKFDFII